MVLIQLTRSVVSIGTERSIIELGQKSLLGKARARPDLVRRALEKARTEGFRKTFQEAMGRLDVPTALGYSAAGVVVEVGPEVTGFSPGDRVACIGAGYAAHAEFVAVPSQLVRLVPNNVADDVAAFGMLACIAMHGVRTANLGFGERVAVVGLGLIGQLTAQILQAYGCDVVGMDLDEGKVQLAREAGLTLATTNEQELRELVDAGSDGQGYDAVLLCVSAKDDSPVHLAIDLCRYRGRIVVVGNVDVHPHRNDLWAKEIELIVSRAGGPGFMDPHFEVAGIDYPVGEVRWTETRNLEEFLRLAESGKLLIEKLISHRFEIDAAEQTYVDLLGGKVDGALGVLFEYPGSAGLLRTIGLSTTTSGKPGRPAISRTNEPVVGVIGAGLFGKALLLPALACVKGIRLKTLCTATGAGAEHTARRHGFDQCTTDVGALLDDDEIDTLVILTPHASHADLVTQGLERGKKVYVEKPLCISPEELADLIETCGKLKLSDVGLPRLMVGYNRRFSAHTGVMRKHLVHRKNPLVMTYRVNAGFVPGDHWVHSADQGRGRIIGEMCHFVDYMMCLTGSVPRRVSAERTSSPEGAVMNSDNVTAILKFDDGSVGNLVYSASGDRGLSREVVELFFDGKALITTDFRTTEVFAGGRRKRFRTGGQDMGYKAQMEALFRVSPEDLPVPESLFASMSACFAIETAIGTGTTQEVPSVLSD
ncbi:MAG: bi-domain-containing oxidoreductase [Rhodospirillales bacterium]